MQRFSGKRGVSRRARPRRGGNRAGQIVKPPQMQSNIIVRHKFRFTSTSGTTTPVSVAGLLGVAGAIAIGANALQGIFQSVKLHQVEVWSPPAAQGAAVTCSLEWEAPTNATQNEVSDTTVSVSQPAYIRCRPPPNTQCAFWQTYSSNVMFYLTAPVGSIIDVTLSMVFFDDEAGPSVTYGTTATATVGNLYYLGLNNGGSGSTIYPPVSLTTII